MKSLLSLLLVGCIAYGADYRPDRVIVKPKIRAQLLDLAGQLNLTLIDQSYPLLLFQLPLGITPPEMAATLNASGLVHWAEPSYLSVPCSFDIRTRDPQYMDGTPWYLHNEGNENGKWTGRVAGADIHAPEGWKKRNSAQGIIVAVFDTGVRVTHEDLKDNIWVNPDEIPGNGLDDDGDGVVDDVNGANFLPTTPNGDVSDVSYHGTRVASLAGMVGNGVGAVGSAPDVKIMVVKIANANITADPFLVYKGVQYAIAKGARVINFSHAFTSYQKTLDEAFQDAANAGIIVIGTAANENVNIDLGGANARYPAANDHDNLICVTGSKPDDTQVYNWGPVQVDLAAPSWNMYMADSLSDTAYTSIVPDAGTSTGAPITAGVVALVRAQYPRESYIQIINRVLSGVDQLPAFSGKCSTGGRLNLDKALSQPTPAPPNDSFAKRFTLTLPSTQGSITATANNVNATKETGEPNHAGNAGGHSIWWQWSPGVSQNQTVNVRTKGSGFNTLLHVYTGTAVNALTSVASDYVSDGVNLRLKITQ